MIVPGAGGLRLAVAQPVSVLHDLAANVANHVDLIERADARVVVFPELSLTGYSLSAPTVSPDAPVMDALVEACRVNDCTALVGGPVPTVAGEGEGEGAVDRHGDRPQIATLVVTSSGVRVGYRKMWLGDEEQAAYLPGREPAVVDVGGHRCGLAICKDTGVADHASLTGSVGMDSYVASVCDSQTDRPVQLERARRVCREQRVWVAMASFAGPTGGGFGNTAGRSTVWRPDGTIAVELDDRPGQVATVTIPRGAG